MHEDCIDPVLLKRKRSADTLLLVLAPALIAASLIVGLLTGDAGLFTLYGWNTLVQGLVIFLPALFCMLRNGGLRAHGFLPMRMREWVLSLVFGVGMFFFVTSLNNVFAVLSELLGLPIPNTPMPEESGLAFVAVMLFVAVTPAIAEEAMFRGAFLSAWLPFGVRGAILHAGILFALLHFQLTALPALVVVGCLLSYLVWATGSVYTSMAAHFSYNASAVALSAIVAGAVPDAQGQVQGELDALRESLAAGGAEGMLDAALAAGMVLGVLMYAGLGVLIAYPSYRGLLRAAAKRRGLRTEGRGLAEVKAALLALPQAVPEAYAPAARASAPKAAPLRANPYYEYAPGQKTGRPPDISPPEDAPLKKARLISWKMVVAYVLMAGLGVAALLVEISV